MYKTAGIDLDKELKSLTKFISSVDSDELPAEDVMEYNNYCVMKKNLELNLERIKVNEETARTLVKTMRINRPTFEAIL